MTTGYWENLLDLVTLASDHLVESIILLAAVMILNDLVRTALMIEFTRSALVHIIVNVLTLLPAVILAAVLLTAGYREPDRAWINLGFGAALYGAWYLGGTLTRLARKDSEGADIGWMAHGIFITLPAGVLAGIIF